MKLHEIYEGYVRFRTVREIADKIVSIDDEIRYEGKCTVEDYKWLQLKCEDEGLITALSSEGNRYTNFNRLDYGEGGMLDTAGDLAKAYMVLVDVKQKLDAESRTKIQQATDEVVHSDEMRELAKQQAFVDLQNSYAQADGESAQIVRALANLSTDI